MNVGDIVRVPKFDCDAIIRFIGEFRPPSLWCGVQLEDKKGDNNGSIYGHKYFSCLPDYGSFLSQNDIRLIQNNKSKNTETKMKDFMNLSAMKTRRLQHSICVYQQIFYSAICVPFFCRFFSVK
eukprot:UN07396